MKRKAQFFIITVILVSGSLAMTLEVLDDYTNINYDQVSASRAPSQFKSFERTLSNAWFNERWDYRKGFAVAERAGAELEDYPVNFTLNTSRMIEKERLQADCSDLRATDESGEELPLQISDGECDSGNTEVWVLSDLEANSFETVYFYYGNDRVEEPIYKTDMELEEFDDGAFTLSNSFMNLKYNKTDIRGTEYCGFTELGNNYRPDFFEHGLALEKFEGDCEEEASILERGNVYTEFEVDGTEYTFFARNGFLRREGEQIPSVESISEFNLEDTVYIGETNNSELLDSWIAGSEQETSGIDVGEFSRTDCFGDDCDIRSLPTGQSFTGIFDTESGDGIFMALRQNEVLEDFQTHFDGYIEKEAGGGIDTGSRGDIYDGLEGRHYMYIGNQGQDTSVPYIDFLVSSREVPAERLRAHTNPPGVVSEQNPQLEEGIFYPSSGWNKRTKITVRNEGDEFLYGDPVNVSLNLAELGVDNASNIVMREEGNTLKHKIWKESEGYDIYDYTHPEDFQMRFSMEDGRGRFVNETGTISRYYAEFVDNPEWTVTKFGTGLDLSDGHLVEGEESLSIHPQDGTPFSLTFWMMEDSFETYDDGFHHIFEFSEDSPGIGISREDGSTSIEARFYNDSEMYSETISSSEEPSTGEWHHVGLVYDSGDDDRFSLFIDGKPVDTVELNDGEFKPFKAPGVDNPVYTIGDGFKGMMDEFKFYPRALEPEEIAHQENELSTVTFLTDSAPGTVSSDVSVYSDGNTGFRDDELSDGEISSKGYSDRVSAVASPSKDFDSVVNHFLDTVKGTRIANNLEIDYAGKCVVVEFSSSIFKINKKIC